MAIGGGTGLSTLLRGMKDYTSNITAIVTVGDDGGSSGRLRRELGMLPPGDFRNCLVAMADVEPLMARLFQYRFNHGSELDGHSFGNLFIVAMMGVTGSFEQALRESSRVLAVRGQALPSTLENLTLCAEWTTRPRAGRVQDQRERAKFAACTSSRTSRGPIPQAIKASSRPTDRARTGPPLHEPDAEPAGRRHLRALLASSALRVYVCNVATQRGETDGFTIATMCRRSAPTWGKIPSTTCWPTTDRHLDPRALHLRGRAGDGARGGHRTIRSSWPTWSTRRIRYAATPPKLAQALIRLYYEKAAAPPAPYSAVANGAGRAKAWYNPPGSISGGVTVQFLAPYMEVIQIVLSVALIAVALLQSRGSGFSATFAAPIRRSTAAARSVERTRCRVRHRPRRDHLRARLARQRQALR